MRSQAFSKAYSAADAKALAGMFTDDVVLTDPEGNETRGKAAVAEMYAGAFQDNPGLKLESQVAEVRFITPDVARVEGQSRLSADGDATEFTRFSSLLVRKDGKWQAAEIREFTAPAEDVTPVRAAQRTGVDGRPLGRREREQQGRVRRPLGRQQQLPDPDLQPPTSRARSPPPARCSSAGTPRRGQIKSWNFDSEGGHGEGLWTRVSENEWVVKAQGVLRDGRPTSATQVHTILNKDSVKTDSIDRIIGGQIAPDIVDVVMVRKPPQPGAVAPSAPAAARPAAAVEAPK